MAATTTERKTPPEKENDIMAVIAPHIQCRSNRFQSCSNSRALIAVY